MTVERQTAAALTQAELRWRLTLDGAPAGIALVALDGRFLLVNNALCGMLGYEEGPLRQLMFQDITHPGDLDGDLTLLARLVAMPSSEISAPGSALTVTGS